MSSCGFLDWSSLVVNSDEFSTYGIMTFLFDCSFLFVSLFIAFKVLDTKLLGCKFFLIILMR